MAYIAWKKRPKFTREERKEFKRKAEEAEQTKLKETEEKAKEELLNKERKRTEIEKYSSGKPKFLWHYSSYILGFLIGAAYLVYAFFSKDFSWPILIALAIPVGLGSFLFYLVEEWEKRFEAKVQVSQEKKNKEDESDSLYNKYDSTKYYTDSTLEYYAFVLSKTFLSILTILLLLGLAVLGFMWFGTISIAPTTIIIILLLIIIFNQMRRNNG